jgi:hypothetical protein
MSSRLVLTSRLVLALALFAALVAGSALTAERARAQPTGPTRILSICKAAGPDVPAGTSFTFSYSEAGHTHPPFHIMANRCLVMNASTVVPITIREHVPLRYVVTDITVEGAQSSSVDVATATATLVLSPSGPTPRVTFRNATRRQAISEQTGAQICASLAAVQPPLRAILLATAGCPPTGPS